MEWIKVKDKYPPIGKKVLVYIGGGNVYTGVNTGSGWATYGTSFSVGSTNLITHWSEYTEPNEEDAYLSTVDIL